jgi:Icc-related predicted phosphoesterase
MENIIFSADLHGNMSQYNKVLDHACTAKADILIFGGDLTPKEPRKRTPLGQRAFFEDELFPALKAFKEKCDTEVLFIMGNDDFKSNRLLFKAGLEENGCNLIDEAPYISCDGYIFIGYSHVPFTPFKYKCWERRDQISDIDFNQRGDTRSEGVISQGEELIPYDLHDALEKPSIGEDLESLTKGLDMEKLILICHAPPFETVCDFNSQKKHVGSKGLRNFIESRQPFMTLHGHIHESVDLMGAFSETIGKTISISVGNDHRPEWPYIIKVGLNDTLPELERLQIIG